MPIWFYRKLSSLALSAGNAAASPPKARPIFNGFLIPATAVGCTGVVATGAVEQADSKVAAIRQNKRLK